MGGFSGARSDFSRSRRGARLKGLGFLVAILLALSSSLALAENVVPRRQSGSPSGSRAPSSVACPVVADDVVLHSRGVLHGVVLSNSRAAEAGKAVAGLRVTLLRDGKVVAETRSDQAGRFVVSHLRGGKYVVAITRQGRVEWSLYRVWTPEASPPKASTMARIVLGEGVVRGQGPLPAVSFSEAALMAGVVVGAVAAPIIYHNAQKSNRVPASP